MEIAYHFVGDTLRDGRLTPPDGEWLTYKGEVVMCQSGLHASRHPLDALQYAPGAILCLVELEDIVEERADKLVARRRRILTRIDATDLLRSFARSCARDVLHLWDAPAVVKEYLETGQESLRPQAAAEAAAWAWAATGATRAAELAVWAAEAAASVTAATAAGSASAWAATAVEYAVWAAEAAASASASAAREGQRELFASSVNEALAPQKRDIP